MGSTPIISTFHLELTINFKKNIKKFRINQQIRIPQVRVIDESGNQLGIMNTADALALSIEKELDLVEVSPVAIPPVCKLINFGKYLYKLKKEQKNQKTKEIETKEVRIGINTGEHDLGFKANNTKKFLLQGNKVQISVLLRGREKAHSNLAEAKLNKFLQIIDLPIIIDKPLSRTPRGLSILIIKDQK